MAAFLTAFGTVLGSIFSWLFTNVIKPFYSQIACFVIGVVICIMLTSKGCSCWYPGKFIEDRREQRQNPINSGEPSPRPHPLRPWKEGDPIEFKTSGVPDDSASDSAGSATATSGT